MDEKENAWKILDDYLTHRCDDDSGFIISIDNFKKISDEEVTFYYDPDDCEPDICAVQVGDNYLFYGTDDDWSEGYRYGLEPTDDIKNYCIIQINYDEMYLAVKGDGLYYWKPDYIPYSSFHMLEEYIKNLCDKYSSEFIISTDNSFFENADVNFYKCTDTNKIYLIIGESIHEKMDRDHYYKLIDCRPTNLKTIDIDEEFVHIIDEKNQTMEIFYLGDSDWEVIRASWAYFDYNTHLYNKDEIDEFLNNLINSDELYKVNFTNHGAYLKNSSGSIFNHGLNNYISIDDDGYIFLDACWFGFLDAIATNKDY